MKWTIRDGLITVDGEKFPVETLSRIKRDAGRLGQEPVRDCLLRQRAATEITASGLAPTLTIAHGLALRYFGGYGHIIAGDLICDPPATSCGPYYQNDGYNLIYIGVALGYSF